ncbi:MAG: hypothetical protein VB032_07605 [Burkholderiaceae bacterium]|nr:hypothetical protein [Burkholderiaceae bacterium]
MSTFQSRINTWLRSAGWDVSCNENRLAAAREDILSQWLLGSRRVRLRLKMNFDAAHQTLHFQETAIEQSRGLPPPTFSVTVTTQHGKNVSENRTDSGLGGGGKMHYGSARQWIEQQCDNEGWSFKLEIGAPF